ncbi:hypothetical protein OF83DRAFT_1139494 [Amylostereum chailletii]|nr:hypothetical protein OF83DRAFT_1139494 [Amylostereum chailletii]
MEDKPYKIRMGTAWEIVDGTSAVSTLSPATSSGRIPEQGVTVTFHSYGVCDIHLIPGPDPKPLRIQIINGTLKQFSPTGPVDVLPRTPTTKESPWPPESKRSKLLHDSPRFVADSEPDRLAGMMLERGNSFGSEDASNTEEDLGADVPRFRPLSDLDLSVATPSSPLGPTRPNSRLVRASQSKMGHLPASSPASSRSMHGGDLELQSCVVMFILSSSNILMLALCSASSDEDSDQSFPCARAGTSAKRESSPLPHPAKRQRSQSLPSLHSTSQRRAPAVAPGQEDGLGLFDEPGFTPVWEFLDMIANPSQTQDVRAVTVD